MRADIHPKYGPVTVAFPDGEEFEIMSTYSKSKIHAEIHFSKHPAWSGGRTEANAHASNINNFNKKFGDMFGDMMGGTK